MAGDHRCPVCQSTFTRPQHVARHMRSHTGDRPYKCQICGDQFARSDLLSRHVNKCHASDKASSGSGRRRGSSSQGAAAAARATVQAAVAAQEVQPVLSQCDQCKHAGLGCDLRSPCTTCHQRRISCTYPRLRAVTRKPGSDLGFSSATSSAIYPPPDLSVPSLLPSTGNLYSGSISDSASNYPNSFYIPSLPNGSDRRSSSLNLHSNTTGSLPGEHNLLNMFPQYASGANPTSGPQTQSSADHGIGMLPVPGSAPSTQTTFSNWNTAAGPGAGMTSDFASMGHNMNQPRPSSLVTDFMFDLPDSRPSTGTSLPSPRSLIDMSQPPIDIYGYRRSDQMSQSASESDFSSSSSPAVNRGSFSAGGNPLLGVNNDVYAQQVGVDGQLQRSDNSNPFAFDASQQPNGRNEVVSNFGMLSLEEAMRNNNAAGNAPFSFQPPQLPGQPHADMGAWSRPPSQAGRPGTGNSSSSAPAATGLDNGNQYAQMTDSGPGLPAISPSTEAREMREFWKNFMCDPYATGDTPHSETPGAVRTPHGSRPAFMRGLSKSASLPPIRRQSFNTTNVGDRYAYDDSTPHASMAQQLGHAVNTAAPPKSLVNPADLRSYEEAIRARPPPVLKFDPRMGRTGAPHNSDLSGGEQGFAHSDSSRRGSLAGISDASPIPSIRRIAPAPGSAAATYSSSDENTSSRPSFKRLASQTLGPAYSKKAAHHRLGSDQADSPSASSASDAQADDDDSESSGDDGRGAPGAPRRHRGMRTGRRANASVGNMLASGRMVIPVTGA